MSQISRSSTRDEVLQAVDAHERLLRDLEASDSARSWCSLNVPDTGEWGRTEAGDVTNLRAFNRHMVTVGEEDQTQPGWDHGA